MRCHLCSAVNFEFLDLGQQPMANKYPKIPQFDKEEFFRVKVYFCPFCKNIQLDTTVSRETMFVDYYYLSSVNKALVEHYEAFAKKLVADRMKEFTKLKVFGQKPLDSFFVVDIGSNDGISLKPLKEMKVRYLGVEPSINVSKVATDAGYKTLNDFFTTESATNILKEHGKASVITGLSMFSHLQDPHQFIEDVKVLLAHDGKFIVEVEYNVEMLKNMAFERFYLDRIFYFSATSFSNLFALHGMHLADAEVTAIHGGSLRVTAKLGKGKMTERTKKLISQEKRLLTPDKIQSFGYEAKKQVKALKEKLIEYKLRGMHVAGYGSPARLSTITNFGDIGPDLIDFVVDDSPLKQDRYSPGKHIPIVSAEYLERHHPDVLVVFAFDYFEDIKKKLKRNYRFLFPIPPREVK